MGASGSGDGRGYGTGLLRVAGSWRLLSVVLLSFSSGLPLGLVCWLIARIVGKLDMRPDPASEAGLL